MATGTSYENFLIEVGDFVSVMGGVQSITGSAPSTASVVLQGIYGETFTVQARDCTSVQHTSGAAMSKNGKLFTTGDRVTANGIVTAVTGSGVTAQVTVRLDESQLSVTVYAGSVHSNAA
jgi:hypothetical protein